MSKRKFYFRMITASLLRRRSRMVIALLAIAIGATILSGLVMVYYDVPRQLSAQFRNYGANMIVTALGEGIDQETMDNVISMIDPGDLVGATAYRYQTIRINNLPIMAAAMDPEAAKKTSPFWMVDGEWPQADGEIMIGKNVATTYNVRIGNTLTCTYTPEAGDGADFVFDNYLDLKICGILDTGGKEEDYVYMSTTDLATLTGQETKYDICEFSISGSAESLKHYAESINASTDAVNARLVKRVTESETKVLSKLQSLVLLVTIVVLILTMICVGTTMTAVVAERRKEIGLRKSLGADNRSIIAEFMGEGILLGAFGGFLGAFLGFAFAQVVSYNVFNSSIRFVGWMIPLSILSSVIVTGIACLIPIRSATEIDPALVLKGE